MPAPKRTQKRNPFKRENDLVEISKMYLQGKTQAVIAQKLDISPSQVAYDLKDVRERWRTEMVRTFDDAVAMQLAKIDLLEAEAWEALERSKEEKIVANATSTKGKMVMGAVDYSRQSVRKEKQNSDVAYMNIIDKCIERRCKLLGLNPPERTETDVRVQHSGVIVHADVDLMTPAERAEEIQRLLGVSSALKTVGQPLLIEGSFSSPDGHPGQPVSLPALTDE